jgi:pyruvate formate lyase activating enzyme
VERGSSGIIFDIKELSLYDGPGLRCTVFMKGCPLRCAWCHNPEGISPVPEVMRTDFSERLVGQRYTVSELEGRLLSYERIFEKCGGVTFSGGEPLAQAEFVVNVMTRLKGRVHTILQTSGYAPPPIFASAVSAADTTFFDLKLMDRDLHKRYTGVDNGVILGNLKYLDGAGHNYRIRIPLIPGVTDTDENYGAIREFITKNLDNPEGIDLLPYNPAAGGKYGALGREFRPCYDECRKVRVDAGFFKGSAKEVKVL